MEIKCDGCERGLEENGGIHYNAGGWAICRCNKKQDNRKKFLQDICKACNTIDENNDVCSGCSLFD